MTMYTVVGFYEDNGQGYAGFADTDSPLAAAEQCIRSYPDDGLRVLCVFEGQHYDLLPPSSCEDDGYCLADFEEDEGGDS